MAQKQHCNIPLCRERHPHRALVCVGWVPVNEQNYMHRSTKGQGYRQTLNPPRIYTTELSANKYSPIGKSVPLWATAL